MKTTHDYLVNPGDPPDPLISELERALSPLRHLDVTSPPPRRDPVTSVEIVRIDSHRTAWPRRLIWPAVAAAALLMLFGAVGTYGKSMRPWTVATVPLHSRIPGGIPDVRTVRAGDVIVTDSVSSARLNVGLIGRTEIEPGSRVRIVNASTSGHRLALDKGTLHARIWAPPRFFLVETRNALAVDLGCVYTLRANPDGSAWLIVQSGEVELEGAASRIRVPAGNSASIMADGSAGLPLPVSASPALRRAVAALEGESSGSLDSVLTAADANATIVLWHLLPRIDEDDRGRIYDRLAALTPIPVGVTREAIIALDRRAVEGLREGLSPSWTTEAIPAWKRWWRGGWSALGR